MNDSIDKGGALFRAGQSVKCIDAFGTFNALEYGKIYIINRMVWNEKLRRFYVDLGPNNGGWDVERFVAASQAERSEGGSSPNIETIKGMDEQTGEISYAK